MSSAIFLESDEIQSLQASVGLTVIDGGVSRDRNEAAEMVERVSSLIMGNAVVAIQAQAASTALGSEHFSSAS